MMIQGPPLRGVDSSSTQSSQSNATGFCVTIFNLCLFLPRGLSRPPMGFLPCSVMAAPPCRSLQRSCHALLSPCRILAANLTAEHTSVIVLSSRTVEHSIVAVRTHKALYLNHEGVLLDSFMHLVNTFAKISRLRKPLPHCSPASSELGIHS